MLCSLHAATRPAVNEEARLFRSRHPDRPVVPVIIGGTTPENFPPALRFAVAPDGAVTDRPETILGPDLREAGDGKTLGLAKAAAGLTGLSTDEIMRRAARDQRRRLRLWIAGLTGVAAALAALTVWALINRQEAISQRQVAESNYQLAKGAATGLVRDIAGGLHDVQGMQVKSLRAILGRAGAVFDKLADRSGADDELKYEQATMYDEFGLTYAAQGDTESQLAAAQRSLATTKDLVARAPSNPRWLKGLADSKGRTRRSSAGARRSHRRRRAARRVAANPCGA